jgi:hypothetical protein
MPFLMSFALEHEIVTFAWIDNASVQFPLNIYATKGSTFPSPRPSPLCVFSGRSAAVLGSSNVSTPDTPELGR